MTRIWTHQRNVLPALLGTTPQLDLRAVTSVQQVSMTMTLILLQHARAAVRVSTPQRRRSHVVTVPQDMQTRIVIPRRLARPAALVVLLQQGACHVWSVLLAGLMWT